MAEVRRKAEVSIAVPAGGLKVTELAEFVASIPPFATVYLNSVTLSATWSPKPDELTVPQEL